MSPAVRKNASRNCAGTFGGKFSREVELVELPPLLVNVTNMCGVKMYEVKTETVFASDCKSAAARARNAEYRRSAAAASLSRRYERKSNASRERFVKAGSANCSARATSVSSNCRAKLSR